jgi:hypothetical protein
MPADRAQRGGRGVGPPGYSGSLRITPALGLGRPREGLVAELDHHRELR